MNDTLTVAQAAIMPEPLDPSAWLWYPHRFNNDGTRGCYIRSDKVERSYFQPIIKDIKHSLRDKDAGWRIAKPLLFLLAIEVVVLFGALAAHAFAGAALATSATLLAAVAVNVVVLVPVMLALAHATAKPMHEAEKARLN